MLAILLSSAALSFAQARARASDESPELRAVRLSLPQAEAARETAGQLPNPTLTASFGGQDPQAAVTLDVRLPWLGQRQTAVAAAEKGLPVAQAEIASATVRIAAAVRRAYFSLAAAQAQVALSEETARLAGQLEQAARARLDNGSASQLEVEQAQMTTRRAQASKLESAAAEAEARGELAAILGAPEEALEASDGLEIDSAAPALDALFTRQSEHPAVAALVRSSEAAQARATAEKAQVIPVPDVSIGIERGQQAPTTDIRFGFAFDLPILSWNRGKVHEAELQAQRSSADALTASLRLRAELRAAHARWEGARARAKMAAEELVPAAEHLLGLARTAYELGRAPLLAVIAAQGELLTARSNALGAALEAQRALADIEEAIGALL